MKTQRSLGFNAVLNVIRNGMNILFPLLTFPYALHVLGAEVIGKVNYTSSIINYFSLLAMLGTTTYAVREGVKKKNSPEKFESFTSEVFTINFMSTVTSYIILFIFMASIEQFKAYRLLLFIQSLSIILSTLGVDWINTIYEDFYLITVRSIVTHLASLICLYIFVKTPNDYYVYASLTVLTNAIICISNMKYCRRYVRVKLTRRPRFDLHLKPLLILGANSFAISIYVNVDTTMLGWIKGDYPVGIYSAAVRIYTIVKQMLAAIYIVTVPRLSQYYGEKDFEKYRKLCSEIWSSLILVTLPSCVGLICISKEIILMIAGEDFVKSVSVLQILGVALLFAIMGGITTAAMNISMGRERITFLATVISSLLNLGLNIIIIPYFSYIGAAVTTLISEIFVFAFCILLLPNKKTYIEKKRIFESVFHAGLECAMIAIISIIVKRNLDNIYLSILLVILGSMISYVCILYIFKNTIFQKYIIRVVKKH